MATPEQPQAATRATAAESAGGYADLTPKETAALGNAVSFDEAVLLTREVTNMLDVLWHYFNRNPIPGRTKNDRVGMSIAQAHVDSAREALVSRAYHKSKSGTERNLNER